MPITSLILKTKYLRKAKRGRNTHGFAHVDVCVETRRCIKTQLVVPDNRHCNAVTLSELLDSDNVHFFARKGKV